MRWNTPWESRPAMRLEGVADEEFVRRAAAGERRAWEFLHHRHGPRIRRAVGAILRDDAEAEDAVQQAWLRALGALGSFEEPAAFAGWLKRIAVNEALGRIRSRARRPSAPEAEAERVAGGAGDPEILAAAREGLALLRVAMRRLPAPSLRVLVLREIEELSVEETARETGLSPSAVKTRLFRARGLLRSALEGGGGRGPGGVRPGRM